MSELNKTVSRTLTGEVTSSAMDKTIVVSMIRKVPHPKYGKYIKKRTKLFAHDPENSAKVGDIAVIKPSRPLSKKKNWLLVEIVERQS